LTPVPLPKASISFRLFAGILVVMVTAGTLMIYSMNRAMRKQALMDAEEKAEIILQERLATHDYINQTLKPAVFALTEGVQALGYFEPVWMSSTYAIRQIHATFSDMNSTDYYYKECAVNARSPENEADAYESEFLRELNLNSELTVRSEIRKMKGVPYFVTMHRGESMEEMCLRCHSIPANAPGGLVSLYGPERSFGRRVGETVSAVSIRVPLDTAYAEANATSLRLSVILVGLLGMVSLIWYALNKRFLMDPLSKVRDSALQISTSDTHLGVAIKLPAGRELQELTEAFNRMSYRVKEHVDNLEHTVEERTADLQRTNQDLRDALVRVKTLSGLLPICASCKKVRDDKGYWNQIEAYIREHSDAEFSHSICPDCVTVLYPGFDIETPGPGPAPEVADDTGKDR